MRRWYLVLVGVCTGWGTIPLILSRMTLPPQAIAFGRVLVASAGLGALMGIGARRSSTGPSPFPRPFSVRRGLSAIAGVLLAVHWLTMFIAFDRAPAGTVILIIFLSPVGIAVVAPMTLGERVSPRTLAAAVVGLGGVALIAGPALDRADPFGLAMAGLSMLLLVALNIAAKPLATIYGGRRLAFMETLASAMVLLPVAAFADWSGLGDSWPWLLLLGLAHTAAGVSLYLAALRHLPVTQVSITSYLEPLAVVVLAWIVLSESPALTTLAGGALVLVAGTMVIVGEHRSAAPPEPLPDLEAANAAG